VVAAAAAAQDARHFGGETTVRVVQVPVWVVDASTGRPVEGLEAADFRVLEDGAPQEITHFAEIDRRESARAGDGAPAAPPVDRVLFLDLYLMGDRDVDQVVAGLRDHYGSALPANARVTVVSFDGHLRVHADHVTAGDEVVAALDAVAALPAQGFHNQLRLPPNPSDSAVLDGNTVDSLERRQRSLEFFRILEERVQAVGAALATTFSRFAASEGDRVAVVFSPGHPGTEWSPAYSPADYSHDRSREPVHQMWRQVALSAADLGFTVFVVDPRGQQLPAEFSAVSAAYDLATRSRQQGARVERASETAGRGVELPGGGSASLTEWLDGSRYQLLAGATEITGGALISDDRAGRAASRIDSFLDHHYSLAYTPDHVGDGRVHTIEVRVPGRPGARLSHRHAYVDQPEAVRQSQHLRSLLLFGGSSNPLGVTVEVGPAARRGFGRKRSYRVPLDVRIPYSGLTMLDRGDVWWGKVTIAFFNPGDSGEEERLWSLEQPITIAARRYREAVANDGYFSFKTSLDLEPGRQEIVVGVQDLVGGGTSLVEQVFEH
jgi:VWFA-related protein